MPISPNHVLAQLRDLPQRGPGTEDGEIARETLITMLEGIASVEVREEGFLGPKSGFQFLWLVLTTMIFGLILQPIAPVATAMMALVAYLSYAWYVDGRYMPLVWLGAQTLSANLVAERTDARADRYVPGRPLVILMAGMDSAPTSFLHRQSLMRPIVALRLLLSVFALTPLVMLLFDFPMPLWMRLFLILVAVGGGVALSLDFWLRGRSAGANDNASGVAAAVAAADRLWQDPVEGLDVRLLLTDGTKAGSVGAQNYWTMRKEELRKRPLFVINLTSVGRGTLHYISETGPITPLRYRNSLTKAAQAAGLKAMKLSEPDLDAVWFARAGVPSLILSSFNDDGQQVLNQTENDNFDALNPRLVSYAASMTEALVRSLTEESKENGI